MASNHTKNYNLNQWVATDKVERVDFNADNAAVETALTTHAERLTQNEETAKVLRSDLEQLELSTALLRCGEKSVRLTAKEFDVLRQLLCSGDRLVAKETLLARVWGFDTNAVENHVEVYMAFLRKKLRSIGSNVQIVAVRRMGYHLELKEDD